MQRLHQNSLPNSGRLRYLESRADNRIHARSGLVLIIVLVVIAVLTLSAYTYALLMQSDSDATRLMTERMQSKYLVDSGVDSIRVFLTQPDQDLIEAGGTYDNPSEFQQVIVSIDEVEQRVGRYSVISPALDDMGTPAGFRYGLTDESTRLNLNVVLLADDLLPNGGRTLLMALPGMTEDVADSILDWIDPDDEVREFGAEYDYYAGLPVPYAPKNGPMEAITELLLVRGVTPEMMFGADVNQNGVIDVSESVSDAPDGEEAMALGWVSYMTLFSKEKNLTKEGLPKINVNSPDLDQLYQDLRSIFDDEWSRFIIYIRQYGPYSGEEEGEKLPGTAFIDDPDTATSATYDLSQILDLVDAKVEVPDLGEEEGESLVILSPIRQENLISQLPLLMDNLTSTEGLTIPGRININQAPRQVLAGIPGMDEQTIEAILDRREFEPTGDDENRLYETWILATGIVDLETMRVMLPYVCVRGAVHRAEITGYFEDGSGTSRAEVVIDSTEPFARILFWRDKSHLQAGYEMETLGIGLGLEGENAGE